MTKATIIRNYRKYSGADNYIIGFTYKKQLYFVRVAEIMPRQMTITHSSSRTGHQPKLQMRLTNQLKEQLLRKGAILLGSETMLEEQTETNKGFAFEEIIYNYFGQDFKGRDNVPFYKGGDIEIDGEQVQIKFQSAQIVAERTLVRLQKGIVG